MSELNTITESLPPRYRVEVVGGGCEHCGQGHLWTVAWEVNGEQHEAGQSWMDKEAAEDVCEFMNLAYGYGYGESKTPTLMGAAARIEVLATNCTDGGAYKQGFLDAATELRTLAKLEVRHG